MTDQHPAPAAPPRPAWRRWIARCKRWTGPVLTAALAIIAGLVLWKRMRQDTWAYYTDGAELRAEVGDSSLRPVLWEDPEPQHFDGGEDGKAAEANTPSGRLEAAFSADGTQLLLVRRPDPDRGSDMFISRWDGRRWSKPQPLKSINTPSNERGPALSRDGRFLYFSSDRDGGRGGYDLYVARWDGKQWGGVKPLPNSVNTGADEHGPALSPDGTHLYFSSDRGGSEDIFVSDITPPEKGGKKQRLAQIPKFADAKPVSNLNSDAADVQAALTARGEQVFLASDRQRDGDSGFKVYFSRVTGGKVGRPQEVDLYIEKGDVTDPAVRMEGYDLLFSAGADDPGYRLYRSTTREVIGYTDFSRWLQFKQLMRNIAWWLLLAIAALIALIYVLEKWRDITNLFHKCLAGSALLHIIALLLAAVWLIALEISEDEQRSVEEIEVELDALAQEELALESIPEETQLTDTTAVETEKEESEFGAPGFKPMEEAQDVPDSAPAEKEAVVEAKPTMSDPAEQPVIEPPADSSLPNELTATVLPEIEPTLMEERDPDQAPAPANPAEEMFEPDRPAPESTQADSAALADQAVESETQPTEVQPPADTALPMESVVEATASPPAEATPVEQPPLDSEMLAQLPQPHFVDPNEAMLDESNPANETPAEPTNDLFTPGQATSNPEIAQTESTPANDTAAATSTADASAVPSSQAMSDSPSSDGAPATPGESAVADTLPPAALDSGGPDGLPDLALESPANPQMEERETDTGASPADTTAEMFEPADPATSPTASQAPGQSVADTATTTPADAAAVAAAGSPADAAEINMQPASAATTSEALPSSEPLTAANLPPSSFPDPTAPPLEEDGLTGSTPADTSNDRFEPGSPSSIAASQAQGQSVADNAAASPSEATAVAAADSPADAANIKMQPASATATSGSLPASDPLAATKLPTSSILDPTPPTLEELSRPAGAPADTSNDRFKPGSPSGLTSSKADEQTVADNAATSPSDAAAVPTAGSPTDAATVTMRPVSAAASSAALPASSPLAATTLPTSRILDPTTPTLEELGRPAGKPADISKDQFKPGSPSTLATSKARGKAVADTAAANPADAAAVAATGSPADPAKIEMRPASAAATPGSLPAPTPIAAANLPASSTPAPSRPTLEEPRKPAGAPADTSNDRFKPTTSSALTSSQSATNPGSGTARTDAPATGSVAGASREEPTSATMPGRALETSSSLTAGGSLVITINASGSLPNPLLPTKLEAPKGALKDSAMAKVVRKQRGKPGIDTIKEMGGSEGTEGSISSAIKWLVENQEDDGRWDTLKHGARHQYDAGAAGLSLLCFYGWGERHDAPCKHRKNVRQALDWLLAQQDDDGYLGERTNMMYSHAIATIALCEAYAITKDKRLRKPAERAIGYSLRAQSKSLGGWRYAPGEDSDTSITGWQYMALHSARMAGLKVPDEAFERVRKHLDRVGGGKHGGLYGYQARSTNPSPAMVATGMFCRQLDLVPPSDPMMQESARWLKMRQMKSSRPDLYYVYYATLALYQHQGPVWTAWNERIKETLPLLQHKTGDNAGSWDPSANITAEGGRVVSTALSTLSLEVYYRLLPMYGFRNSEAEPPKKEER